MEEAVLLEADGLAAVENGEDEVVGGVAAGYEIVAEAVVDVQQIVRVLPCVLDHLPRLSMQSALARTILHGR